MRRPITGVLIGPEATPSLAWGDRLKELARSMAVDVLDYAILDNHLHVVFRNRPDIVGTWTDEEVARRWWFVCPNRKNADGSVPDPKPCEIGLLLADVNEYRGRLSNISWMMRLLCQPIARRANQEDQVDGRFFAKRFDCERLETWAAVLCCSIYVDLNVIRAGIAHTPEESEYTSAYDRIRARWQTTQADLETSVRVNLPAAPDAWLAPVFLDERAEAYAGTTASTRNGAPTDAGKASSACNAIGAPRVSNKGFLPMTRDQYLSLLDVMGRVVRHGKRGFIPADLPPILERLQVNLPRWLDSVLAFFDRDPNPGATPVVNAPT